ncbi:MAG: histidine phosphatase family protein, partial [Actinomycetota bacterium]
MICDLLLVRHGESEWNAVRRWQGQADPALTARGEQQARDAVGRARALGPFEAVVTSTLARAARTGDLLAVGLGVPDVRREAGLIERHAGPWQGLTRDQIDEGWPGYLVDDRRPDGYEDDASVIDRAAPALRAVASAFRGSSVLVVSHGGVINALERRTGEAWRRIDNLEGRWFQSDGTDLLPVGDRVHLRTDGRAPSVAARTQPSDAHDR